MIEVLWWLFAGVDLDDRMPATGVAAVAWDLGPECAHALPRLLLKPPAQISEEIADATGVPSTGQSVSSLRLALEFRRLSCSSNSFTASLYSVSGSSCRGAFSSFSSMRICWEMIVSAVSLT